MEEKASAFLEVTPSCYDVLYDNQEYVALQWLSSRSEASNLGKLAKGLT